MTYTFNVFVCGTYSDLRDERKAVLDAIRKLQLQHDSMEFFGARANQAIETCLDEVRRSDVLVVIVGHLYGTIVTEMGISFSEAEYSEGYRLGKPCLVYIRDEDVPVLPKHMERDPQKLILLREFKDTLKDRHTVATFQNSNDLAVAVAADLSRTIQELRTETLANVGQHLDILSKGVAIWNLWRAKNPTLIPNLIGANLKGLDLSSADLRLADLTSANLSETTLIWANLSGATLSKGNLTGALLGETILGNTDLTGTIGLETCGHAGPSTIDFRTLKRSRHLPLAFLQGCQLPENLIEYLDALLAPPISYYSCFISYSSKDQQFAERLYADLQNKGVRCWFAPVDLKLGEKIRSRIDEVIRIHDKVLLILSQNSINSSWVEHEIETAMVQERQEKRTVLFPIRLDEAVMEIKSGWPAELRRIRHIGDFTDWKNHDSYQKAFDRLLRDLKAEEK